ncbi:MAG TPA: CPBP family intramembrane glutamic endopeptidase [Gemmatimonadales bacterium]|nr:CPBP family intramembrane glutamic endopeptidase [Gemmatimonadales bacterium]
MTAARGGWLRVLKAIGWTVAFLFLGIALSILLLSGVAYMLTGSIVEGLERVRGADPVSTLAQGGSQLVGFLIATWVIGNRALGLGWRELRWQGGKRGAAGARRGLVLGAGAALAAVGAAVAVGTAFWSRDQGTGGDYLAQVLKTTAVLAPAALGEEVMFRGVPLVVMAAAIGRVPALVLVAGVAFSLLHGFNPGITGLALGNIALAGIWLGLAFYAPGGIWTAFGAHLGWNATLAALDAPVSGLPFRIPFLDYHAGGPCWVTGCRFGPEGGLLATAALVVASLVALGWAKEEEAA